MKRPNPFSRITTRGVSCNDFCCYAPWMRQYRGVLVTIASDLIESGLYHVFDLDGNFLGTAQVKKERRRLVK